MRVEKFFLSFLLHNSFLYKLELNHKLIILYLIHKMNEILI